MARLIKSNFGVRIFLDNAVGKGGQNHRSDVGAVQFALKMVTNGVAGPFGNSGAMPGLATGETIGVDGVYGPQTARFIDAYQQARARLPSPALGSMPAPTGSFAGRGGGGGWNFGVLESDAQLSAQGPVVDALARDGAVPGWLKAEFVTF